MVHMQDARPACCPTPPMQHLLADIQENCGVTELVFHTVGVLYQHQMCTSKCDVQGLCVSVVGPQTTCLSHSAWRRLEEYQEANQF